MGKRTYEDVSKYVESQSQHKCKVLSAKPEQQFDDLDLDVTVWNVKTDTDGAWWVVEGDTVPMNLYPQGAYYFGTDEDYSFHMGLMERMQASQEQYNPDDYIETASLGIEIAPQLLRKLRSVAAQIDLATEKYKGAALLQKKSTVGFLTKTMKKNKGEVHHYFIEHSRPAIIDPLEFNLVQNEIARRKTLGRKYSGDSVVSRRIVCGDCGEYFSSKVWHSNSKYRTVIWQCNAKFDGDKKCKTPHYTETELKERFLTAYNFLYENREALLYDCRLIHHTLSDCSEINTEISELREEIEVVEELNRKCIAEKSNIALNQEDYNARYESLAERYNRATDRLDVLEKDKNVALSKSKQYRGLYVQPFGAGRTAH